MRILCIRRLHKYIIGEEHHELETADQTAGQRSILSYYLPEGGVVACTSVFDTKVHKTYLRGDMTEELSQEHTGQITMQDFIQHLQELGKCIAENNAYEIWLSLYDVVSDLQTYVDQSAWEAVQATNHKKAIVMNVETASGRERSSVVMVWNNEFGTVDSGDRDIVAMKFSR